MSRSSEAVLQVVKHVKHKKSEGDLYMMGARLGWMIKGRNNFSVSHSYEDIKTQKISPDTKEKVQLQLVFLNGGADTFHFINPGGRAAQQADRDIIKDLLQDLLPKFRRKISSELEEKNKKLQEDPELFQLYKDLVVSGVVTAEEFWANRVQAPAAGSQNQSQQDVGVSAAFLADIKPQTDGCNGLTYKVTTDVIQSIFRTYPAVKAKHAEYVPDKISESEFWTHFFQSHYFHRDRINFSSKDLFADCAKTDEKAIQEEIAKPAEDSLVDITKMADDTAGEGYGSTADPNAPASSNPVNSSLIQRFNQHSSMVLKACCKRTRPLTETTAERNGSAGGAGDSSTNSSRSNTPIVIDDPGPSKKAKLRDKIKIEDLGGTQETSKGPSLNLTRSDRYKHGPTPVIASRYHTSQESLHACQAVTQEMHGWTPQLSQVLNNKVAASVLAELSPGGALMQEYSQQNQLLGGDLEAEVKNLYTALCELLRHFWACFPVSSKLLEDKLLRMRANLERFQLAKLTPFREKLMSFHYSTNLLIHLESLLSAAYEKFNTWQSRRMAKRS